MKVSPALANAYEFACHSAACRPPTSGGTGGSSGAGGGSVAGRRLKPGQKVSVKSSAGGRGSVGSVKRDRSGKGYSWESKVNGRWGGSGQAKSYAEAVKKVQSFETYNRTKGKEGGGDIRKALDL